MNQIRLVSLQQGGSLHFGKINGQGDVLVQGPSESLRVVNLVSQKVFGKLRLGNIVLDRQNLDIVASLFQILEYLSTNNCDFPNLLLVGLSEEASG